MRYHHYENELPIESTYLHTMMTPKIFSYQGVISKLLTPYQQIVIFEPGKTVKIKACHSNLTVQCPVLLNVA